MSFILSPPTPSGKEKADSLEDDRNHWRKQAESVTLLLETDRKKPASDWTAFRNVFYFVSTYAFWGLPAFAFALHGWQGMSRTHLALSFCRLLGLGCPKQAFAKIATPRYQHSLTLLILIFF
jgi:hypothetical protein